MLYQIFKAIKEQLSVVNDLKDIQWFNNQYDTTIHTHPVAFIEFPEEFAPQQISNDLDEGSLAIRIHVVSKVISRIDNDIPDIAVQQNEDIAMAVKDNLNGFTPTYNGNQLSTRLKLSGWQHYHKYSGWMVTFVSFTTNIRK